MAIWGKEKNGKPEVLPVESVIEDLYPGYTPVSYDSKSTTLKLKDSSGKSKSINIRDYYKHFGITVTNASSFNTQDNALEESPVNFLDRLKMSFSVNQDRPYGIKNIRKDLQDAQMTQDGTLVVKDNGIWKRVDPSGLDPGDLADMVGYLIPLGLGSAAMAASSPTAPFTAGSLPILASSAGGSYGEVTRQNIGSLLGVKKPGVHLPSVAVEAVSWPAAKVGATALGKAWAGGAIKGKSIPGIKDALRNSFAYVYEYTSGIPRDVTKYVLSNPSILFKSIPALKEEMGTVSKMSKERIAKAKNELVSIKLPTGKIEKISRLAAMRLASAVRRVGEEIDQAIAKSPAAQTLNFSKDEILSDLVGGADKVVTDVWRGVDHFTPKHRAIIQSLIQDIESKPGTKGANLTFEKVHNLKRKLYNFLDYESSGSEADLFLKKVADKWAKTLGSVHVPYKMATEKYGLLKDIANKFGGLKNAANAIDNVLNKVAKGTAKISEKANLGAIEENIGRKIIEPISKVGETVRTQRSNILKGIGEEKANIATKLADMAQNIQKISKAQTEFSKGPQLHRMAVPMSIYLPEVAKIASGQAGSINPVLAGAVTAMGWPQVLKGLLQAKLAIKPVTSKIGQTVAPIVGTDVRRTVLSKTLLDLLNKQL